MRLPQLITTQNRPPPDWSQRWGKFKALGLSTSGDTTTWRAMPVLLLTDWTNASAKVDLQVPLEPNRQVCWLSYVTLDTCRSPSHDTRMHKLINHEQKRLGQQEQPST